MPDPSNPGGVSLSLETVVALVTGSALWPVVKWLYGLVTKHREKEEKAAEAAAAATKKAVEDLASEVRQGFARLEGMIHSADVRVTRIEERGANNDLEIRNLRQEVHDAREAMAKVQGRLDVILAQMQEEG